MLRYLLIGVLLLCMGTPDSEAKGKRCTTCARTTKGRIVRNHHAVKDFKARTGYPHGRPGYVVDHIIPLACGGADAPYNLAWQTVAEAKAKDKWETRDCTR